MELSGGEREFGEKARDGSIGESCDCCKKRLRSLERSVKLLEDVVRDKDAIISNLKAKHRQVTVELVEYQLENLRKSLSEKDSSLAIVELKLRQSDQTDRKQILAHVKTLQAERNVLAQQFKSKVNQRFQLSRADSDDILQAVAKEYKSYSRDQLCSDLRSLDQTVVRLKSYIDQLLAVALESNPGLLEGMPRIQQNSGLKMELFSIATLTELLEEVHEKEKNCQNLQDYASLLLHKLMEHVPQFLDSFLIPKWEEVGRCWKDVKRSPDSNSLVSSEVQLNDETALLPLATSKP